MTFSLGEMNHHWFVCVKPLTSVMSCIVTHEEDGCILGFSESASLLYIFFLLVRMSVISKLCIDFLYPLVHFENILSSSVFLSFRSTLPVWLWNIFHFKSSHSILFLGLVWLIPFQSNFFLKLLGLSVTLESLHCCGYATVLNTTLIWARDIFQPPHHFGEVASKLICSI